MLIIPLHRRPTWENFPLVTAILILVNVFVFAAFQSKDDRAYEQAVEYYKQVHLDSDEVPAYAGWMREHGRSKDVDKFVELPPEVHAQIIESDPKFLKALDTDQIIKPDAKGYASWKERRTKFEELRDAAFTEKHMLRFSHFEPGRIFSSMFLHGGMEHLIGNMVFLALLGLLVEGALGSGWYPRAVSARRHRRGADVAGGALQRLRRRDRRIGRDRRADGRVLRDLGPAQGARVLLGVRVLRLRESARARAAAGVARLAAAQLVARSRFACRIRRARRRHRVRRADRVGIAAQGWMRNDFIEQDEREEARAGNVKAFDEAMQLLGRLDVARARDMLTRIDESEPGKLPVIVALYRCARYKGTPAEHDAAITRVLATKPKDIAELRDIKTDLRRLRESVRRQVAPRAGGDGETRAAVVASQRRSGRRSACLRTIEERSPNYAGLPGAWFAFAMRAPEKSPQRRARLEHVVQQHGQSDFGSKARFLLTQA